MINYSLINPDDIKTIDDYLYFLKISLYHIMYLEINKNDSKKILEIIDKKRNNYHDNVTKNVIICFISNTIEIIINPNINKDYEYYADLDEIKEIREYYAHYF